MYIKKRKLLMDFKGEIDSTVVIAGVFNTLLSLLNRSSRPKKKKINNETVIFNNTLDLMDLIDITKHFIPKH